MCPPVHGSHNNSPVITAQDAEHEKKQPDKAGSKTDEIPFGSMKDHPIYRPHGPSSPQLLAALQIGISDMSLTSSSGAPALGDTPFQTIMVLAQETAKMLKKLSPEERTIENAKEYANLLSQYFPHSLQDVNRMKEEYKGQNESNFLTLIRLAKEYGDSVQIFSQHEALTSKSYLSPKEVWNKAKSLEGDEADNTKKRIFSDFYVIAPKRFDPMKEGEDVIDARLVINVKREYSLLLAEIFFFWAKSDVAEVYQNKFIGPALWGIKAETGIVMLEEADFGTAAALSKLIHQGLTGKLGREVSADELYGSPPSGSQKTYPGVAPGLGYIEVPSGPENKGAGKRRADAAGTAAVDHVVSGQDLATALKKRLIEVRISDVNPACVLRPGEDPQVMQDKIDAVLRAQEADSWK